MAKSTKTYFNSLKSDHRGDWEDVDGSRGVVRQLTLAVDLDNGDYTRLTRFIGKVDTSYTGAKRHDYPEEVFIVSGRIYDVTFGRLANTPAVRRVRSMGHSSRKTIVSCSRYPFQVKRRAKAIDPGMNAQRRTPGR